MWSWSRSGVKGIGVEGIDSEFLNLKIVMILTVGFGFASLLGYLSHSIKLSPILGYLLAGYLIGPYSPGFIADLQLSEQLAEIGVILMMFSVGLHFELKDLLNSAKIAIPGAICQTFIATLGGTILVYTMGGSIKAGLIFGLAIGVASTVVLVRILSDHHLLKTTQGHIAVGWLIVEDMITVAALLLLPSLAQPQEGAEVSFFQVVNSFAIALLKFALLLFLMFTLGQKVVTYIFQKVNRTRSHELFTLTILAITFLIATGSTYFLGTSIVLGAFIGGMVIGQTGMREQISTTATPLKDTFVVIFFLSIGMLFNPQALWMNPLFFCGTLAIILLLKPLVAYLITLGMGYPAKTALILALALAQIGEFSFILAEEAVKLDIMPDEAYDIIVASSLVSIALNPPFFNKILRASASA